MVSVETQSRMGDLEVLVLPYPLEGRAEDELRRIADEYDPKALQLLGVER